ncbi:MAG: fluoride efflux transporter CrcB [Flavobacteriaceae bacterium]|jgi:CrcB protein|nr:fluoride efflux transporter CrcB [Flavobacteriaceae bacterium]
MKQVLLVFLGGGVGSVLRYLVTRFLNNPTTGVPYGTFLVNIIGSFLIGIILGLALKNEALNQNHTLLLATGFCGGFTTFSAFAYENHLFLKSGNLTLLFGYTIASIVVGLLAVFLGIYIVKQLNI